MIFGTSIASLTQHKGPKKKTLREHTMNLRSIFLISCIFAGMAMAEPSTHAKQLRDAIKADQILNPSSQAQLELANRDFKQMRIDEELKLKQAELERIRADYKEAVRPGLCESSADSICAGLEKQIADLQKTRRELNTPAVLKAEKEILEAELIKGQIEGDIHRMKFFPGRSLAGEVMGKIIFTKEVDLSLIEDIFHADHLWTPPSKEKKDVLKEGLDIKAKARKGFPSSTDENPFKPFGPTPEMSFVKTDTSSNTIRVLSKMLDLFESGKDRHENESKVHFAEFVISHKAELLHKIDTIVEDYTKRIKAIAKELASIKEELKNDLSKEEKAQFNLQLQTRLYQSKILFDKLKTFRTVRSRIAKFNKEMGEVFNPAKLKAVSIFDDERKAESLGRKSFTTPPSAPKSANELSGTKQN